MDGQPNRVKLGTGHVKFYYDKLSYLKDRYEMLYTECVRRGFNVQNYIGAWDNIPKELMGDYQPTKDDRKLIQQRIIENDKKRNQRFSKSIIKRNG